MNSMERKPQKTVRFSEKKEIYLIMEKANEKKQDYRNLKPINRHNKKDCSEMCIIF